MREYDGAGSRFRAQVADDNIKDMITAQTKMNTLKNRKWSINVFNEWRLPRSKYVDNIQEIHMLEATKMNYWLQCFINEERNRIG